MLRAVYTEHIRGVYTERSECAQYDAAVRGLARQAAQRGGEEEGEQEKKSEDQMADGGSAALLRGWLRWFHGQRSSSGLLAGSRPAQRFVVGVNRDAGAQRESDGIAGSAVKCKLLPVGL